VIAWVRNAGDIGLMDVWVNGVYVRLGDLCGKGNEGVVHGHGLDAAQFPRRRTFIAIRLIPSICSTPLVEFLSIR
jgi:hypothetical protein